MDVVYKTAETNEEIKNWVEKNGGTPAVIDDPAISLDRTGLRINWKGNKDESMLSEERNVTKNISWERFFEIMENKELIFMYSDDDRVNQTWRYKFVNKYESEE